jgi:Methane oxygenase PmoA
MNRDEARHIMTTQLARGNHPLLQVTALAGAIALLAGVATASAPLLAQKAQKDAPNVQLSLNKAERRVDITVDGKPFTSYIWPTTLKKPVLFPLRSAAGTDLTRGFPPRPGERADHPHHVGLWFNYGDVGGIDFWNNSDATAGRPKMGTIVQTGVTHLENGKGKGELTVTADWVSDDDKTVMLKESTKLVFRATGDARIIDRISTLTANGKAVTFGDSKEGMYGMRLRRQLEMPVKGPAEFTDASGKVTKVAQLDNTGVTGTYLTSEGKEGGAAWGTRANWCALFGNVDNEDVAIVVFDHPSNPNHPAYWHARDYGLFAVNPLGRHGYDDKQPEAHFTIDAGKSQRFVFRVLLLHGKPSAAEIEARYKDFAKDLQ